MQEINKIKGYRVMAGITQEEMAKVLGITRGTYVLKELGTRNFSIDEYKLILRRLNECNDSVLRNLKLDDIV